MRAVKDSPVIPFRAKWGKFEGPRLTRAFEDQPHGNLGFRPAYGLIEGGTRLRAGVSCLPRRDSPLFGTDPVGGVSAMVLHRATHTGEKMEGLAVEFGCGLSGDECEFF